MASTTKEVLTDASPDAVWDAIRDIGALHTRLVPGFVVDTKRVPGGRVVTFANGMVAEETIISSSDSLRRQRRGSTRTHASRRSSRDEQGAAGPGPRVVLPAD